MFYGSKQRGATLLETLAAVGTAAVLVSVAVPWFGALSLDMRRASLTNDFLSDLATARIESIRRGKRVALCVSADQATCAEDGDWTRGRILFEDSNNNASRDDGEPLLGASDATDNQWKLTGNATVARYISYHPLGRARLINGAFQAGTITICATHHEGAEASQIVISTSGRPRSQRVLLDACD